MCNNACAVPDCFGDEGVEPKGKVFNLLVDPCSNLLMWSWLDLINDKNNGIPHMANRNAFSP